MKDRYSYLKYPTILIYLVLSGLFIATGYLEMILIASLIIIIIGIILYTDFKNKNL